jgi:hypothetical protein
MDRFVCLKENDLVFDDADGDSSDDLSEEEDTDGESETSEGEDGLSDISEDDSSDSESPVTDMVIYAGSSMSYVVLTFLSASYIHKHC